MTTVPKREAANFVTYYYCARRSNPDLLSHRRPASHPCKLIPKPIIHLFHYFKCGIGPRVASNLVRRNLSRPKPGFAPRKKRKLLFILCDEKIALNGREKRHLAIRRRRMHADIADIADSASYDEGLRDAARGGGLACMDTRLQS